MHGRSRALDLFQHVAADSYFILHATKPDPSSDELGRMTSTAGAPRRCCLPSHVLHCKPARRRELHFVSTSGSSCVPKLADTWQLLGAFSLPEFQCAAHCRWGRPGPSGRLKVHGQPGRGHAVRDPLCAAGAAGGAPPPTLRPWHLKGGRVGRRHPHAPDHHPPTACCCADGLLQHRTISRLSCPCPARS